MRLRLFGLLLAAGIFPGSAAAAPVVLVPGNGRAVMREDPFLRGPALTPAPAPGSLRAGAARGRRQRHRHHRPRRTVASELGRLLHTGQVSASSYHAYLAAWNGARRTERRLRGTRAAELGAVIALLQGFAAARQLTASRLPVLFLTLARNQQYWSAQPLLANSQRVEFQGSQLVWQYYAGQGLQLQVLGTFGRADALYTSGPGQYGALRALLSEMLPLAALRSGSLTWEYYFDFGGGRPPWTSAMSQGTAIEAFTRGYLASAQGAPPGYPIPAPGPAYLGVARALLRLFTRPPPAGVAVPTPLGARYLQYSFAAAPSEDILNAFLQSLIGLYDYAQASGDPLGRSLFAAGDAEAQAEVPQFDTGAWSLYQPGEEDSLSYHELVTGFLQQLCARTGATSYCTAAQHFQQYLTTPPALSLLTTRLRTRHAGALSFRLSKASHVGVVVTRGNRTLLSTSASFAYGVHSFALPRLKGRGTLAVRMSATDLAGNFSRTTGTIVLGG